MITMTRPNESTAPTGCLLLAFELGQRSWKLGFTVGMGQRPRIRQIPAGAVGPLVTEIERAKKRLGLPADSPVISCYEAGRDGFWFRALPRCSMRKAKSPTRRRVKEFESSSRAEGSSRTR